MNTEYLAKYFGKKGITSSQANFVADQIKEYNKQIDLEIATTSAYEETIIGFRDSGNLQTNYAHPVDYTDLAQKEGKLYALSAWLREAITARNHLINYYSSCDTSVFAERPKFDSVAPVKEIVNTVAAATAEDVMANFTVAELAEFFKLQACAAHIGKRIHQGGKVSDVRTEILSKLEDVVAFRKIDDVSYPVRRVPVYSVDQINLHFTTLQNVHREYEQKLNNYKARIQNGIVDINVARQTKYRDDLARVNAEYNLKNGEYLQKLSEYNDALNKYTSEVANLRSLKVQEVSSLKIVIPNDLQDIYDFITSKS